MTAKRRAEPKLAGRPAAFYRSQVKIAGDGARTAKQRTAALASLSGVLCERTEVFQSVVDVVRDTTAPSSVRLTALQALQAASFKVLEFTPCRPAYLAALRGLVRDPDLELRQRVLGVLSREKDRRTQQLLLEGLRDQGKALVSPEKALQLLSYDIHAESYPVARAIVRSPPSDEAKREALRLLAADVGSAPIFERILRDKNEGFEARQISASALQALAPQSLQSHAREIVLDESEPDDLRATSLVALSQFGKADVLSKDEGLRQAVDRLRATTSSASVKQAGRRFLGKHQP